MNIDIKEEGENFPPCSLILNKVTLEIENYGIRSYNICQSQITTNCSHSRTYSTLNRRISPLSLPYIEDACFWQQKNTHFAFLK